MLEITDGDSGVFFSFHDDGPDHKALSDTCPACDPGFPMFCNYCGGYLHTDDFGTGCDSHWDEIRDGWL